MRRKFKPCFVAHIVTGIKIQGEVLGRIVVMEDLFLISEPDERAALESASNIVNRMKREGLASDSAYGPEITFMGKADLVGVGLRRLIECKSRLIGRALTTELTYQKMILGNEDDFYHFLDGGDVNGVTLYE